MRYLKKKKTAVRSLVPLPVLRCKTDSFVIEGDVHFPTDWNLLWDSARKCCDIAAKLQATGCIEGWQKHQNWKKELKSLVRQVGRVTGGGGKNKQDRLEKAVEKLLTKSSALARKVAESLQNCFPQTNIDLARCMELGYYYEMLIKHMNLLERRVLKGETIPHKEKVFSIFQPFMEWINKGKPNPEIGKKLFVTSDQYHLIVDWQIGEHQTDNELTLQIASRLLAKYTLISLSVDKGFSDKADREILELYIPEVVMPKKGKRTEKEKAHESQDWFENLKDKHSAIESNINELEHRGLNRCKNRTWKTFKNYTALSITAYNLHKIGRELQAQAREELREQKEEEKRKKQQAQAA